MDGENKQNAQELNEQELEQATGAGTKGRWVCLICRSDKGYDMVDRMTVNGVIPMLRCRNCHSEF